MRQRSNIFFVSILLLAQVGCGVFFPDQGKKPSPEPTPDNVQPDLGIRDPHGVRASMKAAGVELGKTELILLYGAFDGVSSLLATDRIKATESTGVTKLVTDALKAGGWEKADGAAMKKALNAAQTAYRVAESRQLVGTDGCKQDLIDMYRLMAAGVSDAYKEVDASGRHQQAPRMAQ